MIELTQKIVDELLIYDENSGVLVWRWRGEKWFSTERSTKIWNGKYAWTPAFTTIDSGGYKNGAIFNRSYRAHRIIWLLIHGEWPNQIDHINGIRHDNRLINLRNVSRLENSRNAKVSKNNKSGFNGVYWDKRRKNWKAAIIVNNKFCYLGNFKNIEDAIAARKTANREIGFHENHGRKK